MLTVWGTGRGVRVLWLLEEMELPYRFRPVDLLARAENDPEFLAINPAGFIPVLQDADTVMVESIAILQYLLARHGPSPLAPDPREPAYAAYLQFLHLGEAGLAVPMYFVVNNRHRALEVERPDWTARYALEQFESRLALVTRRLAEAPYMAGDGFTAADISVVYALQFGWRVGGWRPGEAERAYVARCVARPAYARALAVDPATRAWAERADAEALK